MLRHKQSTMRESRQVDDRTDLVDALITASRVLVSVAVRSIDAAEPAVTITQHRILVVLAARGPQRIGDLAVELNVNSSNATRHCDRLQRAGLVERQRSADDGRAVCVSLTAAGRDLLQRVTTMRRAEIAAILDGMPPEHHQDLVAALHAFGEAAGEISDSHWSVSLREASA